VGRKLRLLNLECSELTLANAYQIGEPVLPDNYANLSVEHGAPATEMQALLEDLVNRLMDLLSWTDAP
jgi:hypothetical protein